MSSTLKSLTNNNLKIYETYFEDSDANIFYFYTGKNTIIGLQHPDYIVTNKDNHKYARIAFFTYNDIGDDSTIVYINETLSINIISTSIINNSTTESEDLDEGNIEIRNSNTTNLSNYSYSKSFNVHFESLGRTMRVIKDSIKCTVVDSNITNYAETENQDSIKIMVTEDTYFDDENIERYGIGLWVKIINADYVTINVDKSLSTNSIPINTEHFPSLYTSEYLNNNNKEDGVNLLNTDDLLKTRLITESMDYNSNNSDRIKKLEEKSKYDPHQFIQNTVQYNPTYEPKSVDTEETIQGTTIIGPVLDRIITLDPIKKTFSVKQDGIYALQLKNGFYLIQGNSRLDLKVYIGTNQIKEMNMSAYLSSNDQDDERKAIKNTYSSQIYIVPLKTTDEIKLTATWDNIDNIVLENETMITCTALQYNLI